MKRVIPILASLLFAAILIKAAPAEAAGMPTDSLLAVIKDRNQAIMDIVRSETGGDTDAEREQLRAIVSEMFDFRTFAEESLGRYWDERTDAERTEFASLCRELIERNYADPALYKKAEEITYKGATEEENTVTVSTVVRYKTERSTIDYRMHAVDGGWRIFDMVIDDLSVARSNRSQFRKEIRKTSYEGLVKKLKDKLASDDSNEG